MPIATTAPRPRATRARLLTLLLALVSVATLAGCSKVVGPRSFAMSATTTAGDSWNVVVKDSTGWVTGIEVDPKPAFADPSGLPMNVPGTPTQLVIPWVGGDCDVTTTFTVTTPDTRHVTVSRQTEVRPGACDAVGIAHQLVLETAPALPADMVTVVP